MKDLLSKERYCYKIHVLLMKSSAYHVSIDTLTYIGYPHCYRKILISPSMIFRKFQTTYK